MRPTGAQRLLLICVLALVLVGAAVVLVALARSSIIDEVEARVVPQRLAAYALTVQRDVRALQAQLDRATKMHEEAEAALSALREAQSNATKKSAADIAEQAQLIISLRERLAALTAAAATTGAPSSSTAPAVASSGIAAEIRGLRERLGLLEMALFAANARNATEYFSSPTFRKCDFTCSGHGLGVRGGGGEESDTPMCRCECVGGWSGAFCQNAGVSSAARSAHSAAAALAAASPVPDWPDVPDTLPPLGAVPFERDVDPAEHVGDAACRAAAVAYFRANARSSEEFSSDRALTFWFSVLARGVLVPSCSSEAERLVLVDIGAHVGNQLAMWQREFLSRTDCAAANDTLLVLAEPSPANLAVLRPHVARAARDSFRAGDAVVMDAAVAHFDGAARFVVDRAQNRAKQSKGNERGRISYLRAQQQQAPRATERFFVSRVLRLTSLVELALGSRLHAAGAPAAAAARGNGTERAIIIPLLKIDAEGFDPAVLYGGVEVLRRTNVVVFECQKLWPREEFGEAFSLREVVEYLSKLGFNTYRLGLKYSVPMTGALWADDYDEKPLWSNCAAIRRGHPAERVLALPPPCDASTFLQA